MNLQVATIPEIVSRGATFILLLCLCILLGTDVISMVPFDHRRIVYRAAMEIVVLIVMFRMEDSSFVRDMIDIGIYFLIVKMAILVTYFTSAPAFLWLTQSFFDPFAGALDILTLVRLFWVSKVDGRWQPGQWPAIGLHGWLSKKLPHGVLFPIGKYITVGLVVLLCITVGVTFAGSKDFFHCLVAALATCGTLAVAIFTKPLGRALQLLLMTSEERHDAILQYEEAIIRSAAALSELRKLEAEKEPKPERQNVVQLVRSKPEPDAGEVESVIDKGTEKGPTDQDKPT